MYLKDIPDDELYSRYKKTQNGLHHLKTQSSRRKKGWKIDFHAIDDPFTRDLSVILSSKAWRRLSGKNQVASTMSDPHIRNRATHVCEVMAHSMRICDHLGLNTNLVSAIAAGHDIGHVPFGHQGEHYLQERLGKKFTHEIMGVIIAQHIERRGEGLNLTHATLDGMYRHSGDNASESMTPEAWIVRYADKIAYLFADYNDFIRMRWNCSKELVNLMNWFGSSQRRRTFRAMMSLCEESVVTGKVTFENSEEAKAFKEIRHLMYDEYVKVVEQNVSRILDPVYDLLEQTKAIPPWLGIALLTDNEVSDLVNGHKMISWKKIMDTGLGEIIDLMDDGKDLFEIDPVSPDLDW